MQERVDRAPDRQLSRRLLPIDAWREPDKYLDLSTGLIKKELRGRRLFPTDARGLVQPEAALHEVQELFWDDYVPIIDQNDPELKTDRHHIYYPRANYKSIHNNDSLIPYLFREQSSNLIEIYRPTHNVLHDLYRIPDMPSQRVMAEELEEGATARQAMKLAIHIAKHTVEFQPLFAARRYDIAQNPQRIGSRDYDEIGEAFLRKKFDARHARLQDILNQLEDTPYFNLFFPDSSILRKRPAVVAAKFGEAVARRAVDYVDRSLPQAA